MNNDGGEDVSEEDLADEMSSFNLGTPGITRARSSPRGNSTEIILVFHACLSSQLAENML